MAEGADCGQLKSWNSTDTVPCRNLVVNNSDVVVDVLWVTPDGSENSYRILQPGQLHRQGKSCAAALDQDIVLKRMNSDFCHCYLRLLHRITHMFNCATCPLQRHSAPMSGGCEQCTVCACWLSMWVRTPHSSCWGMGAQSLCMMGASAVAAFQALATATCGHACPINCSSVQGLPPSQVSAGCPDQRQQSRLKRVGLISAASTLREWHPHYGDRPLHHHSTAVPVAGPY
jgi:hypothetical protein